MARQFASTIADSNPTSLTITSLPSSRKLKELVLGAFFVFIVAGIFAQLLKQNVYIILYVLAAFFFIPALITITLPIDFKLTVSSPQKDISFINEYILGFGPRARFKEVRLEPGSVEFGFMKHRRDSPALVRMYSGGRELLLMNFSRRPDDISLVRSRLASFGPKRTAAEVSGIEFDGGEQEALAEPSKYEMYELQREIKSWRSTSIILGLIHFAAAGFLAPAWGIVLIAVGLASNYFKEAAMLAIYAFILAWVGVGNMLNSGSLYWGIFGGYQIYLGYRVFVRFRHFLAAEREHSESTRAEDSPDELFIGRAAKLFPRLGCLMSTIGLLFFAVLFGLAVIVSVATLEGDLPVDEAAVSEASATSMLVFDLLVGLIESIGILGLAFSLAGLLAGFKPKWMVWGGVLEGGAFALIYFGSYFL